MLRFRPTTLIALLALAAAAPAAAQTPVHYGPGELGEVRSACFLVCFGENCSASGTVSSLTVDPPFFVRGIRRGPHGMDLCSNTPGLTQPVTLPATVAAGQQLVWDVDLVATQLGGFDSLLSVNGMPLWDLDASVVPLSGCSPSPTATCLTDDRFKVRVKWRTDFGTRGPAQVVPFGSDDSGMFYFFNADNWEMLLKVLDACEPPFNRFWVFAAATTNVEYTLTVTDTQAVPQRANSYFNPQGNPAQPIQDTAAFATCP